MTVPAGLSYETHRPAMQIAFQHTVGRDFRYVIARVTGHPVHVATIYDGLLYEAAWEGMRKLPAAHRLAVGTWEVFEVPVKYDTARGIALEESRLGWAYDWKGCIYAWWAGRIAGKADPFRVFCSEEGGDVLLEIGVPLLYRRTAHYHPRSLRDELVKRHGWTSRMYVDGVSVKATA